MSKYKVWIDTDAGCDDAQALLYACKLDSLDIVGVSAVAGNVPVDKTFKNARDVLHLANRDDIKVYKGAEKPLIRKPSTAEEYHGLNGVGDVILEESPNVIEKTPAHEALYQKAKELNGELIVCTMGPLTNMAVAISNHPDIVKYLKDVIIMGGAVVGGNRTSCAEFNIYADPEAAETLFKSGVHVTMCGLDATLNLYLSYSDLDEINVINNKITNFLDDSCRHIIELVKETGQKGYCIHDCAPLFYLEYPEMFKAYDCGIYVETQGSITLGKTVCDLYTDHKWEDRHCTVLMDANREMFVEKIKEIYQKYN